MVEHSFLICSSFSFYFHYQIRSFLRLAHDENSFWFRAIKPKYFLWDSSYFSTVDLEKLWTVSVCKKLHLVVVGAVFLSEFGSMRFSATTLFLLWVFFLSWGKERRLWWGWELQVSNFSSFTFCPTVHFPCARFIPIDVYLGFRGTSSKLTFCLCFV
jgi:hypothetical protein